MGAFDSKVKTECDNYQNSETCKLLYLNVATMGLKTYSKTDSANYFINLKA